MQESTIGAAFFTQVLSLNEATIKFDIWDTAGQERYHSLAPMYYRGAAAAVVVYDITSMVAFFQDSNISIVRFSHVHLYLELALLLTFHMFIFILNSYYVWLFNLNISRFSNIYITLKMPISLILSLYVLYVSLIL